MTKVGERQDHAKNQSSHRDDQDRTSNRYLLDELVYIIMLLEAIAPNLAHVPHTDVEKISV